MNTKVHAIKIFVNGKAKYVGPKVASIRNLTDQATVSQEHYGLIKELEKTQKAGDDMLRDKIENIIPN